jgi:septal ring factor EnvC (AmiA/AmiB activator)
MTTDERLDRIEHVTAAFAEERRKDREEYRQLWRDTQRQINELTLKIADTNDAIRDTNDAVRATNDTLRAETVRAQAAEQELRDRISALVSAIGQFLPRP